MTTYDNDKRKERWLLLFVLLWAILLILTACSVDKKAQRKAAWLISRDKLGEFCNIAYPPKPDSIVTRDTTIYDTLPGESVILHDTIPCKDTTIYRDLKCPPGQKIIEKHYKDTTIYKDNPFQRGAYEQHLREKDKVIAAKDDVILEQQKKIDKNDWWRVACIITWSLFVLVFVVRFFVVKRPI